MQFYDIHYITQHQSLTSVIRSISIILLLIIVMTTSIFYLRNRIRTRWRDISIGFVLLTLILLGIQFQDYFQSSQDFSQSQTLVKLIESVAVDHDLKPDEVVVNATSLADGIIVRFKKEDYRVHLNEDNNTYTLERTHIIDHNVYINKGS